MTIKKFLSLLSEVPDDATLLSDSGWECGPTNMNGVFYNKEKNKITFTQGSWYDIQDHIGEKCLYCTAWDDADKNSKGRIEQDLREISQCYLDESRIVREYIADGF